MTGTSVETSGGIDIDQVAARLALLSANCRRIADFIDVEDQCALLEWAFAMEPLLRRNGPARAFGVVDGFAPGPGYDRIAARVREATGLGSDAVLEPEIGQYLSIISSGGAVHPHRDSTPPGTRHLRCNLFLQTPEDGGRPLILGIPVDVAPRMLLAFYPSDLPHASEAVVGAHKRVILSFGFVVSDGHRLPIAGSRANTLARASSR